MLAQKPPMGWNSWNTFSGNIDEKLIMETADAMANFGYKDVGYEYVVIDDCWAEMERDSSGRLVADAKKFPHGMKYLSDYIHSKGLKFGTYSCAGVKTCAGYPSSYGHEFVDAKTFADWGVDFLKYDFCNFPKSGNCRQAYHTMSMALKATGREILFSACNWGSENPGEWMRSIGVHMYRSTGDIQDNFNSFSFNVVSQIDKMCMSAPGCFNDPDMLIVGMYGNGSVGLNGCTDEEYKTHFALWCMFGVPLIMGGDIRNLNEVSRKLLQNRDLIAINQDEEGRTPYIVMNSSNVKISMIKHLANREFVLAFFNLTDSESQIQLLFHDAGLPYYSGKGFDMTDVFTGENVGVKYDSYSPSVPAHGCKLYKAVIKDI